jgi:hypothetical protein
MVDLSGTNPSQEFTGIFVSLIGAYLATDSQFWNELNGDADKEPSSLQPVKQVNKVSDSSDRIRSVIMSFMVISHGTGQCCFNIS